MKPRTLTVLLLPAGAVTLLCFVLPVLWLARMSLNEALPGGGIRDGWTLASYVAFLTDEFYLALAWDSISLSLGVTLSTLVLTYPIALFLFRWQSPWRGLVATLTISPLLVSAVVRTYGWLLILGDGGWINGSLKALGLIAEPIRLVGNTTGVAIGLTEILMPYMALSLLAGFGRLDRSLEEAAQSLGAGPVRTFLRVTLPLSLPGIALGSLLVFVLAISSFITPKLLGGGRVFLMATEIYDQAMVTLNWPFAGAIAMLLLGLFGLTLAAYGAVARR